MALSRILGSLQKRDIMCQKARALSKPRVLPKGSQIKGLLLAKNRAVKALTIICAIYLNTSSVLKSEFIMILKINLVTFGGC